MQIYGCVDCGLASAQDDLIFYLIALSPFLLTVLVSYPFVRLATAPIGYLRLTLISILGAVPSAIGLAWLFQDKIGEGVATALLAVFLWAATIGPIVVFFAQWIYFEIKSMRRQRAK